ncbi:MAG TPA: hypothetical protein VGD60_00380 [Candidatus Acidoferrales bacterium]
MLDPVQPGPNRAQLAFKEAVLAAFDFLRSYGLRPVKEEVTFVRYESGTVFVNVYHGRASYEIGVEAGRLDRTAEQYGLYQMVSLAGPAALDAEEFGQHVMFQVGTREGVQRFVPKVAALVKKYGSPFLRGDAVFYDEMAERSKRESLEYWKEQNLIQIQTRADAAWHAKDYARVIELYAPVRADLNEVETKKLAYSELHAGRKAIPGAGSNARLDS